MVRKIGFVGLGNMGRAIVRRMLEAGLEVLIFDIDSEAMSVLAKEGAVITNSAVALADEVTWVISCLPDDKAVLANARALSHGRSIQVYIELSTVGPSCLRELESILDPVLVIDSPMSGGEFAAQRGSLSLMIACATNLYSQYNFLASTFSEKLHHVGTRPGLGQLCKVVNNAINFSAFLVSCEAIAVGVKNGISADTLLSVVNHGTGKNTGTLEKIPRGILGGNYNLGGPIGGVLKDLSLYLEQAQSVGLPKGLIDYTRELWSIAMSNEQAHSDAANIIRFFENQLGILVRGTAQPLEQVLPSSHKDKLGFIGLGNMGGAIVKRLLSCGVEVTGFDLDKQVMNKFELQGLVPASSVRDVADQCSLVVVCIPTGGSVSVCEEAAQGDAIEVYAEFSTMSPGRMRELNAILAAHNVALVDAPVSGGVAIADRGELSIMMAGEREAMSRLANCMQHVAANNFPIGNIPGQAQFTKLVNNAIGFTVFIADCEALSVGVANGMDPQVLLDTINSSSGRNSWTMDKFARHILSRSFDAGGKMPGGPKALDLYLEQAKEVGMNGGMVAKARDEWACIAKEFSPTDDFTKMITYFEKHTGADFSYRSREIKNV